MESQVPTHQVPPGRREDTLAQPAPATAPAPAPRASQPATQAERTGLTDQDTDVGVRADSGLPELSDGTSQIQSWREKLWMTDWRQASTEFLRPYLPRAIGDVVITAAR